MSGFNIPSTFVEANVMYSLSMHLCASLLII